MCKVLQFGMLAVDTPTKGTRFEYSIYRPGTLNFKLGHLSHKIQMSWDDTKVECAPRAGRDYAAVLTVCRA